MLKKELLEILCCPQCKGDLNYNSSNNSLTCTVCGKVYDVKEDIPILLPDHDGK